MFILTSPQTAIAPIPKLNLSIFLLGGVVVFMPSGLDFILPTNDAVLTFYPLEFLPITLDVLVLKFQIFDLFHFLALLEPGWRDCLLLDLADYLLLVDAGVLVFRLRNVSFEAGWLKDWRCFGNLSVFGLLLGRLHLALIVGQVAPLYDDSYPGVLTEIFDPHLRVAFFDSEPRVGSYGLVDLGQIYDLGFRFRLIDRLLLAPGLPHFLRRTCFDWL